MKKKFTAPDGSKDFTFILGGYIRVYKGAEGICARNGEAGITLYHTDPDELKKLGEFLIQAATEANNAKQASI
jgi:hypothetical protein